MQQGNCTLSRDMTILYLDTEVQNIDSTYSYQINNQTIQLQKNYFLFVFLFQFVIVTDQTDLNIENISL